MMKKDFELVVLAAGKGKRLRPITLTRPKHAIRIGGKPLLHWTLDNIVDLKPRKIIVVVHYFEEKIREILRDKYRGIPVKYVRQREMRGTGDAVKCVEKEVDTDFLVIMGDVYVEKDGITKVVETGRKGEIAVGVTKVQNPWEYGVCILKNGGIVGIIEKPERGKEPSNIILAGVYYFDKSIFEYLSKIEISPRGEYELPDALVLLAKDGRKIVPVELGGGWVDIGRPRDLLKANQRILETKCFRKQANIIKPPVYIGKKSIIPRRGSLGPHVTIDEKVEIGDNCNIKNSIIMSNTIIEDNCEISGAIIGEDCQIEENSKILGLSLIHI